MLEERGTHKAMSPNLSGNLEKFDASEHVCATLSQANRNTTSWWITFLDRIQERS
jgi:hypothetical protein